MAGEICVFTIIVIIVIIVFVIIFLIFWIHISKYIRVIKKIITIADIIYTFTKDVAIIILHILKELKGLPYEIFEFHDTIVIGLSDQEINNSEILEKIGNSSKRIIIVGMKNAADSAVSLANQIADKWMSVSVVLFDPIFKGGQELAAGIHFIEIKSSNVSSKLNNRKQVFHIMKPIVDDIDGYIASVKKGFISG